MEQQRSQLGVKNFNVVYAAGSQEQDARYLSLGLFSFTY